MQDITVSDGVVLGAGQIGVERREARHRVEGVLHGTRLEIQVLRGDAAPHITQRRYTLIVRCLHRNVHLGDRHDECPAILVPSMP